MNTEQERAAFEAWANGRCELHLVNPAGRYSSAITQFAWEAYQAGRAAISAPAQQERKRRYAQGTALGEFGIIPMCDQVDDEPVKVPSDDLAHEIWAAAQTAPGEGIEDAVERVAALLARRVHHDVPPRDSAKHQEQPQHVEADGTGE